MCLVAQVPDATKQIVDAAKLLIDTDAINAIENQLVAAAAAAIANIN
jgi:hypothetical protein